MLGIDPQLPQRPTLAVPVICLLHHANDNRLVFVEHVNGAGRIYCVYRNVHVWTRLGNLPKWYSLSACVWPHLYYLTASGTLSNQIGPAGCKRAP